jgi:hypothetical protein
MSRGQGRDSEDYRKLSEFHRREVGKLIRKLQRYEQADERDDNRYPQANRATYGYEDAPVATRKKQRRAKKR